MDRDRILVTQSLMPDYEDYIEMIKPLWESHWLTNMGTYHEQLTIQLKDYLKVDNISLMANGHMSLEMVIQAMNFPAGSEVITTPFTFVSTTHAIIRNNLVPVFCDIKEDDYTIDETKIEELITEKTVAIIPVHVYGNICNIEVIEYIAYKYGLKVIYDAAHAFGEEYKGIGVGNFGDASILSFHATKVFNTIEGGAVCYRDNYIGKNLYDLKNFGIRGEELVVSVGANAKMNEFEAAMGLCNLKIVDEEIQKRKRVVEKYITSLKDIRGICVNNFEKETEKRNYAYFPILCDKDEFGMSRDELYEVLRKKEIYTRKYFYPLTSDQVCFKNRWKYLDVPVAKKCSQDVLVLPMYGELTDSDIETICETICSSKQ